LITHTRAAQRLWRYNTAVPDTAPVTIAEIELHPNSGLAIVAGGDEDFNLTVSQLDPEDGALFDPKTYTVTAGSSITIYHRGAAGAMRAVIEAAGPLSPDVRFYGMSQP
jgi:ureidoglycolate hydrolase